jgi:hypothetical protein
VLPVLVPILVVLLMAGAMLWNNKPVAVPRRERPPMSTSPLTFWEFETIVAYLISLGIMTGGVYIVSEAIVADAALPWMIAGLATVGIGISSIFEPLTQVKS